MNRWNGSHEFSFHDHTHIGYTCCENLKRETEWVTLICFIVKGHTWDWLVIYISQITFFPSLMRMNRVLFHWPICQNIINELYSFWEQILRLQCKRYRCEVMQHSICRQWCNVIRKDSCTLYVDWSQWNWNLNEVNWECHFDCAQTTMLFHHRYVIKSHVNHSISCWNSVPFQHQELEPSGYKDHNYPPICLPNVIKTCNYVGNLHFYYISTQNSPIN